jgi:hypothetical protein
MESHGDVNRVGSDNFGRHRRLHHAKKAPAKFPKPAAAIRPMKSAATNPFGWTLAKARRLPFKPVKSQLKFFTP